MRFTWCFLALIFLLGFFSTSKLDAYGYQPDSLGYAYTESSYFCDSSPLMPVAAIGAAIIIGVILYSGSHHHSHHHSSH